MAEALKITHPGALITFFSVGGESSRTWFGNRSWFDFSFLQRKTPTDPRQYTGVIGDYEKTPVKPTHLGEFAYEYEFTGERWPLIDALPIRRAAYLSMLSGAMGYTYGRRGLWHFNGTHPDYPVYKPWQDLLTDAKSPGAGDVARMRTVLESISWPDIVPDHAQDFGTSGDNQGTIDYTASAVATNGNYAIAYFPKRQTTEFDLSRLGGSEVVAEWYDPADGSKQVVAGSPFPKTNRNFTPPGSNSAGDDDWVLLFTANGGSQQGPSRPKNFRLVP
jgi:hypothetical protein